jgi:hypothetical protein
LVEFGRRKRIIKTGQPLSVVVGGNRNE